MLPALMLHAADVHVGLSGSGGAGAEEAALSSLVDLAIAEAVDVVLIAGDLFDHGRVPDHLLEWTAAELNRADTPVVLLVGNHDPLNDYSVHRRFDLTAQCPKLTLLGDPQGSIVRVPDSDVVVWGRAMIEHERRFKPLAGVPPKPVGCWGVVAAHGIAVEADGPGHHASPMRPEDFDAITWDYVALGHHHGHRVVRESPCPAVYPGAAARSRGGEPGVVLVSFNEETGVDHRWASLGQHDRPSETSGKH